MGSFLNPGNTAFKEAVNAQIYIDKTELIDFTNQFINTPQKFICCSRPRRFGKSMAADMLLAYYNKESKSKKLFAKLAIAECKSFKTHLNKYDVICFDIQECIDNAKSIENTIEYITKGILKELSKTYPKAVRSNTKTVSEALNNINQATGNRFVVIIDEWDALFRTAPEQKKIHEKYITFIRSLFKGAGARRFIALAYITGILPIKKHGRIPVLDNFMEYTMINPYQTASCFGFTEEEVKGLCQTYNKDFIDVKRWYDGYKLNGLHIYNPFNITNLILQGDTNGYWLQSGTYGTIKDLINTGSDELYEDILKLLTEQKVKADLYFSRIDMEYSDDKNNMITLLAHLGYLTYNNDEKKIEIPNQEISIELHKAIETLINNNKGDD